jgi:transcriptional regulator with XRE-family HTH domain
MAKRPPDVDGQTPRAASPLDYHLGARLRTRRLLLGITQEQLGEAVGVTFQQVQKYELGLNRISASRLFEFATALGVTIQSFYEDAPAAGLETIAAMNDSNALLEVLQSREGLALTVAFAQIRDPKLRNSVVEFVRSLALSS